MQSRIGAEFEALMLFELACPAPYLLSCDPAVITPVPVKTVVNRVFGHVRLPLL